MGYFMEPSELRVPDSTTPRLGSNMPQAQLTVSRLSMLLARYRVLPPHSVLTEVVVALLHGQTMEEEEGLSLGEAVPRRMAFCDLPPGIVLRTRERHRALVKGDLIFPSKEENAASHKQFPEPWSVEQDGWSLRGNTWMAVTEDERAYPHPPPTDPRKLVVSFPASWGRLFYRGGQRSKTDTEPVGHPDP